jgi:hypothetical protein
MCRHYEEEPNDGNQIIVFFHFFKQNKHRRNIQGNEQINHETYDERNSQNAREKCQLDSKQIYLLENGKNNL